VGYASSAGAGSELTVVGMQDGTVLTVTPKTALQGHAAGVPFNVTVNAGHTVMFGSASGDVTGTHVASTAPVAVFGGASCSDVPSISYACDHLLTALPSTDRYTKSAIVPHAANRDGTNNLVRVVAGSDNAQVFLDGMLKGTLALAGDFLDINSGAGGVVTSDKPVLVTEFLTGQSTHPNKPGDPALSWVPGADQYLKDYIYSTRVGTEAFRRRAWAGAPPQWSGALRFPASRPNLAWSINGSGSWPRANRSRTGKRRSRRRARRPRR